MFRIETEKEISVRSTSVDFIVNFCSSLQLPEDLKESRHIFGGMGSLDSKTRSI